MTISCELVCVSEADAAARMRDVDVVVTLVFTQAMADHANRLRLVQVPGAGLDRIDRAALPRDASLANVHGHEVGIAEYVLGTMLALTRDFSRIDAALRRGEWLSQWAADRPAPPVWGELAGKTLAILGYGRIGRMVARRARAFDMEVIAIRAGVSGPDADATVLRPDAVHETLGRADFVALTLPLTDATRGLLGEAEFRAMKPTAFLINVARGEIVDQHALFAALIGRQIAGAALDVWYNYPSAAGPTLPAHLPFHELPNVLMTPHVSGWTDGMMAARAALIASNIERCARGEAPENKIS